MLPMYDSLLRVTRRLHIPLSRAVVKYSSTTNQLPANRSQARLSSTWASDMQSTLKPRVAVLYQGLDPPVIDGIQKPKKPGGYLDSSADIAYNLSLSADIEVVCSSNDPKPEDEIGWSFPDTEDGIIQALEKGATHLWANTVLFAAHPLQVSPRIAEYQDHTRVVCQGPLIVEKYDDKDFVNELLRKVGGFTMPEAWTIRKSPDIQQDIEDLNLPFPVVAKPIRGRGSHGVRVCYDLQDLTKHARSLFKESPVIMLEEFLSGEEATVTVMPPAPGEDNYWTLPVVTRFNHINGVAPYNGVIAVTANSRAITTAESEEPAYKQAAEECQRAAQLLGVTAPIRIDVRRFDDSADSKFALFDVNMKPNMTGPGRPGRQDQASLTLLGGAALGWDYQELLRRILTTSPTLRRLRSLKPRERMPIEAVGSTLHTLAALGIAISRVSPGISPTLRAQRGRSITIEIPSRPGLCTPVPHVLMEDDEHTINKMGEIKLEEDANGARVKHEGSTPVAITNGSQQGSRSPTASHDGVKSRSESADTPSSSKPPRLSRKASQKLAATREPMLFDNLPDVTTESCDFFQLIPDCLYGSKHLGSTDNDALDCECREEWRDGENLSCGEDSDCINRATKMECSAEAGNCGGGCHNQRFQRKQYASVSVIKTEKKGFGLRADADLQPNDFVFEYIGEVINEPTFRRRMLQYDDEGIKHFYFMSLNKSEFVDATKKGNLGRFCNHSCNPNCYVDKWVVGDKLRMGIFTSRKIQSGEELVFNYNVDRYGADPQPCYCGEPNCVGFIGGKTQTERATKLPAATVEALGIDGGDGWDTSVAKKPRRKKPDEDDEEYVNSIQPRSLSEDDARKVMATLMQSKEKWIAVKLLERIQLCDEERVIHCVMRMHAYQILKTTLNTFLDDHNVVIQVLSILDKFPRLTRNKIQDSKIEATVEGLTQSEHEDVASRSKKLLDEWSKLEVAYRIRRRKFDPSAPAANSFEERRGASREDEPAPSASKTASPRTIDAPKGPRNLVPQRSNTFFHNGGRPRRQPFNAPLPPGWFTAKDAAGNTYFYDKQKTTTWQRPTQPATDSAPKAPSRALKEQLAIQNIIDQVTEKGTPKQPSASTPKAAEPPIKDNKEEKWRSLPTDKQMKIYENTLFPHIKHVLDKFHHKLPKEELKRLGKDIAKKLVASDYKNSRVADPSAPLSDKQAKKMKKYVKDFLDRAVQKYGEHQKRKTAKETEKQANDDQGPDDKAKPDAGSAAEGSVGSSEAKIDALVVDEAGDITLSDQEGIGSIGSPDLKRKREDVVADTPSLVSDGPTMKRLREDEMDEPSSPPPPPPPPQSAMEDVIIAEQQALREQEEDLVRENEEAQRLEDEANRTKGMEEAAQGAEMDVLIASNELSRMNHETQ
ncbi:hypothetical protein FZEAL_6127 [Fusarium zealandicum]|uniref:Histone-lysine N-methyltransferase, H3 lysine-36 specific n=1 Tax=Fusarium zealandicum TaxID=1053134 RepID=A0A8H4UIH1_9HYPO|nr:hypothetical protein FZEAL_6127 [Fusarium zealandicum]